MLTQEQWATVNRIFHVAADLSPREWDDFVRTAAEGNADVTAAVLSLLEADRRAGDYLSDGVSPLLAVALPDDKLDDRPEPDLLQPGTVLSGRFRVVRKVGAGGMGEVFQAQDLELDVPVAVKVIRPALAQDAGIVARFRQEVRLARTVTHPNVCRTFDLERAELPGTAETPAHPLLFLTMEFLPGESLADRLRREGKLPMGDVYDIARQIAAGLGAAHERGVIHRDIKPQNILLVPGADGTGMRAVLTDFGLARAGDLPGSTVSVAGSHALLRPVGTFAYMAPEQLDGGQISPATDLYAFGLVLFEMCTGRRAWGDLSLASLAGFHKRLHGPTPMAGLHAEEDLPPHWRGTIERCLQPGPEFRFGSAAEVVAALDGDLPAIAVPTVATGFPWRRAWWAAAVCGVVALGAVAVRYRDRYLTARPRAVPVGTVFYLPPAINRTGSADLEGVSELMRSTLSQSAQLSLLDEGKAGTVLQQMRHPSDAPIDDATAREVAMRAGVPRVLLTDFSASGRQLRLTTEVQEPDTTPRRYRDRWTRKWDCGSMPAAGDRTVSPALLRCIRDASDWVRRTAGEPAEQIANLSDPLDEVTTPDWDALRDYSTAERLAARGRRTDAVLALQSALKHDPQFALAEGRLGDLLYSLNRGQEGKAAYQAALSEAAENRLTRRERDRIRGLYAVDTWDFAAAEAAFRDSLVFYENDYFSLFYRGDALYRLGRTEEAATTLRRAQAARPGASSAPYLLAHIALSRGDAAQFDASREHVRQADKPAVLALLDAHRSILAGDPAAAEATLLRGEALPFSSTTPYLFAERGSLSQGRGDLDRAAAVLTRGMEVAEANGDPASAALLQLHRAAAHCEGNDAARCAADFAAALSANHADLMLRLALDLVGTYPQLGPARRGAMLQALDQWIGHDGLNSSTQILRALLEGERLQLKGAPGRAIPLLRAAAAIDAPAEPKPYLSRALRAAASAGGSKGSSGSLLAEADRLDRATVREHAYLLWRGSWLLSGVFQRARRATGGGA